MPVSRRSLLAHAGTVGALAAAPTALLAACGGAAEQGPAKGTTPVSLRITSWLVEQPSVEAYKTHLVEPFKQESPNTTVTVEPMAFAVYPEKVQAYGASGDLPDIIEVSYAWFPEWVKLG